MIFQTMLKISEKYYHIEILPTITVYNKSKAKIYIIEIIHLPNSVLILFSAD